MKLALSEGEKYPHWFISTRAEVVKRSGEEYAEEYFDDNVTEVPEGTAQRWLIARDSWAQAEDEIEAFLKTRQTDLVRRGQTGNGRSGHGVHLPRKDVHEPFISCGA